MMLNDPKDPKNSQTKLHQLLWDEVGGFCILRLRGGECQACGAGRQPPTNDQLGKSIA